MTTSASRKERHACLADMLLKASCFRLWSEREDMRKRREDGMRKREEKRREEREEREEKRRECI